MYTCTCVCTLPENVHKRPQTISLIDLFETLMLSENLREIPLRLTEICPGHYRYFVRISQTFIVPKYYGRILLLDSESNPHLDEIGMIVWTKPFDTPKYLCPFLYVRFKFSCWCYGCMLKLHDCMSNVFRFCSNLGYIKFLCTAI